MSRKNFKVDTATNGQTPKQDTKHLFVVEKTNVPTGKIKTKEEQDKRRKAREEQYKNFRVNALKRRAKRMGLSDEDIEAKVKALLEQLDTPNSYNVLVLFNENEKSMFNESLKNEGLVCKIFGDSFCIMEADQETLTTIRGIAPPSAKIHPYVKKKPSVLQDVTPKKEKKPSNNNKNVARTAKINRKASTKVKGHDKFVIHKKRYNVATLSKEKRKKFREDVKALKAAWKASKKASGTTVPLKPKKGSTSLKKASTLKKAA